MDLIMPTLSSLPVFILMFVWLLLLSFFLFRAVSHYNRLTLTTNKKNLKDILVKLLDEMKVSEKKIDELFKRLETVEKDGLFYIQRVGLLRFNPFADTGGEQSFILSLLDGEDNGIILTSLHSRSGTRWYAKEIRKGKGRDFELSKEEQKVIKTAKKLTADQHGKN